MSKKRVFLTIITLMLVAAFALPTIGQSAPAVAQDDCPYNEAPMLALAMRQARRNNATVAVMDPRPVFLPFAFEHLPADLDEVNGCLGAVVKAAIDPAAPEKQDETGRKFYAALPEIEQMTRLQQEK